MSEIPSTHRNSAKSLVRNTNARLKSKARPDPQKVMSVVKSPRLEPRRTTRLGYPGKTPDFGSENPGAQKPPYAIVTLSFNAEARSGMPKTSSHEKSTAPQILCCKNNAAFENVT
jgi:hypothetical protein